ncbi:MAG: right-handed parallel beta-helix repeat-containing protein [Nanoarchaeota archaeon]|nr:right-handed parallel beta-helix repeat-containing protein [Nanoarchaeota archaeon]
MLVVSLMVVGTVSATELDVNSIPDTLSAESIPWDGTTGYVGADFEAGRSEITILTEGMTLGDLTSINFEQYITAGYPASVNILLDVDGDGVFESKKDLTTGYLTEGGDDVLKIEWAYNGDRVAFPYTEESDYNRWFNVFDTVNLIDDTTNAWLYSVKPGDVQILMDTLANWKLGISRGTSCWYVDDAWHEEVCDDITIDSNTKVYGIEIETLGWIAASSASVRNIHINEEPYYTSIQDAIDDSAASGVINVAAGTYTEDLTITTDNLELVGADKATTTIKGVANVPIVDLQLAVPNIDIQADGVKIHGFTIEGPDYVADKYVSGMLIDGQNIEIYDNNFVTTAAETVEEIAHAVMTYGTTAIPTVDVSGLIISDNAFTGSGSIGLEAIYIGAHTGSGTITINGNQISGSANIGITVESGNVVVSNNIVDTNLGYETAPYGTYGIRFFDSTFAGTYDNIVVSGNNVQNFKRSIRVGNGGNDGGTATTAITASILSNTLTNNVVGIWARAYGADVTATGNSLAGNTAGIQNDGTTTVNAENNWWGTAVKTEIDALITGTGTVGFEPWCSDSTCSASLTDADGDGYTDDVDCDDTDDTVNPGATETWYDGTDQDCDGANDYDQDGDTYVETAYNANAGGTASNTDDCDDTDATINPGATEVPNNSVDDNCNGAIDEAGASQVAYDGTWASTVKAALDWLFNRAEQDTTGVNIYLHQGWNTFKMPGFVLSGTAQNTAVADALAGDYSVTNVLSTIDGNYNYLAYYDGTNWQTNVPADSAATTFTSFPTAATDADYDFQIYMTSADRLVIE